MSTTTTTQSYAITPSAVAIDKPRDYADKNQIALFNTAIASLYQDMDDRHDNTPSKVQSFLSRVADRAAECAITVVQVPISAAEITSANPTTKHICYHHGELSMELLQAYVKSYLPTDGRKTQDDQILLICIRNSLKEPAYQAVKAESAQFSVNGTESGLLMLKVVLMNSAIDALADPDVIRTQLANAYQKFKEDNYDVLKFNNWVLQKVSQLTQMGTTSTDLRSHLFTAYESSPDEDFVRYIAYQRDEISDNPTSDYSYQKLMTRAKEKHNRIMTQRQMQQFKAPSKEEDIVALTATVNELKKQLHNKQSAPEGSTKGGNKNNKREGRKPYPRKYFKGIPQELKSKPKPQDITKPVKLNDKDYYYCLVHGWCNHPFDNIGDKQGCFMNFNLNPPENDEPAPSSSSNNNDNNDGQHNGRLVRALGAVING